MKKIMNDRVMYILIILGAVVLSAVLLILGCMQISTVNESDLIDAEHVTTIPAIYVLFASCGIVLLFLLIFRYFDRGR